MLKLSPKSEDLMINKEKCIGCGACIAICPMNALSFSDEGKAQVDTEKCVKCGVCQDACPVDAIDVNS